MCSLPSFTAQCSFCGHNYHFKAQFAQFGHAGKLCGLPTPWEQEIPSRVVFPQHRAGKSARLRVQKWLFIWKNGENGENQLSPAPAILAASCDPKRLQWRLPKPPGIPIPRDTPQPPHSIQIFQVLSAVSGCAPTPSTTQPQKKIYIQGQAFPLMENSSNITLLGEKIK